MSFSKKLKTALEQYDRDKGFFRRCTWDHPGVAAVKKLVKAAGKNNQPVDVLAVLACFITSGVTITRASYRIYACAIAEVLNIKEDDVCSFMLKLAREIHDLGFYQQDVLQFVLHNSLGSMNESHCRQRLSYLLTLRDQWDLELHEARQLSQLQSVIESEFAELIYQNEGLFISLLYVDHDVGMLQSSLELLSQVHKKIGFGWMHNRQHSMADCLAVMRCLNTIDTLDLMSELSLFFDVKSTAVTQDELDDNPYTETMRRIMILLAKSNALDENTYTQCKFLGKGLQHSNLQLLQYLSKLALIEYVRSSYFLHILRVLSTEENPEDFLSVYKRLCDFVANDTNRRQQFFSPDFSAVVCQAAIDFRDCLSRQMDDAQQILFLSDLAVNKKNLYDLLHAMRFDKSCQHVFALLASTVRDLTEFNDRVDVLRPAVLHNPRPLSSQPQNTHKSSVVKSVSQSAKNLAAKYYAANIGAHQDVYSRILDVLQDFKKQLEAVDHTALPLNFKNTTREKIKDAALLGWEKITSLDYTFNDDGSNISILQLLAIMYFALQDDVHRNSEISFQKSLVYVVEGLYEICRGKNIDEFSVDDGRKAKTVCTRGCFNKLIEKMQPLHDLVTLQCSEGEVLGWKFPVLVNNIAVTYLKQLAHQEQTRFAACVRDNDACMPQVLWDKVRLIVRRHIVAEFSALQERQIDEFIQCGTSVNCQKLLAELQPQKQHHSSEGLTLLANHSKQNDRKPLSPVDGRVPSGLGV
jgi:hypothetical protein